MQWEHLITYFHPGGPKVGAERNSAKSSYLHGFPCNCLHPHLITTTPIILVTISSVVQPELTKMRRAVATSLSSWLKPLELVDYRTDIRARICWAVPSSSPRSEVGQSLMIPDAWLRIAGVRWVNHEALVS